MSTTDPRDWSDDKLLRLRVAATELLADSAPFAGDETIQTRLALIDAEITRRDLRAAVAELRADFLPRNTARSVHTGQPMTDEQRSESARRARNVHARSVHSRRAAMYVHPCDHSRRFGPERERSAVTCGHGVSLRFDCGACDDLNRESDATR